MQHAIYSISFEYFTGASTLSLYCAITAHLDDEDKRTFSLATPKTIVCCIKRTYGSVEGNVPSSRRIVQDCDKAIRTFNVVYTHGGGMVPGLTNRNSHRSHTIVRNTTSWGGVRIKNLLVAEVGRWLHDDAVSAKK